MPAAVIPWDFNSLAPVFGVRAALPLVDGLLGGCRPSAVIGTVWAVVVNAIDGATFRARPHVAQKTAEIMAPLWRHVDAACSVVFEMFVMRVVAAVFRGTPRVVFARVASPVLGEPLNQQLHAITTTTPAVASLQVVGCDCYGAPARTPAFPEGVSSVPFDERYDSEPIKHVSSEIVSSHGLSISRPNSIEQLRMEKF